MDSPYRLTIRRTDSGVALVTVLVIVAIVSTIAADLALKQHFWISQAQNLKDRTQAEWVLSGSQQYAAMALDRDKQENQVDNLNEAWAQTIPPLQAEGGEVSASISDMQGLFNLNSLYHNGKYDPEYGAVFRRLLVNSGIDTNVQDALLDWIDSDDQTRSLGAEDSYYMNLVPGYRAANQPIQSVRELLLIKGFTPDAVNKLEAVVTALPRSTAININTAPVEVLAALFDGMSVADAKQIVEYRREHPFQNVGELKNAIHGSYQMPNNSLITTSSEYFLVRSSVQFGRYSQSTLAYLYRPKDASRSYYYFKDRPLIQIQEEKTGG